MIHVILIMIRAITNILSCQVNGKSGQEICQLLMMSFGSTVDIFFIFL